MSNPSNYSIYISTIARFAAHFKLFREISFQYPAISYIPLPRRLVRRFKEASLSCIGLLQWIFDEEDMFKRRNPAGWSVSGCFPPGGFNPAVIIQKNSFTGTAHIKNTKSGITLQGYLFYHYDEMAYLKGIGSRAACHSCPKLFPDCVAVPEFLINAPYCSNGF